MEEEELMKISNVSSPSGLGLGGGCKKRTFSFSCDLQEHLRKVLKREVNENRSDAHTPRAHAAGSR